MPPKKAKKKEEPKKAEKSGPDLAKLQVRLLECRVEHFRHSMSLVFYFSVWCLLFFGSSLFD
jgi:hypothetical protein